MPRVQLYKIRRLVKVGPPSQAKEVYNWLVYDSDNLVTWVLHEIDATAFADYKKAQALCETVKTGKLRHPRAIYHAVVPA